MSSSFRQKRFLIIGASGGIGSHVARMLSDRGASLALAAPASDRLKALADDTGGDTIEVDAISFDSVDECFKAAADGETPLAGAVNCVGSMLIKPAHLTTEKEWHRTIEANLTSAFAVIRSAGKFMTDGGSVVLISSVAGQKGFSNHEAIAAAKGGVAALARSAAASYAPRFLRVNAVSPSLVRTPMTERITSNERTLEGVRQMHPLHRIGEPEDVASAIVWLLDPANSWVTGQVLGVDGGMEAILANSRHG